MTETPRHVPSLQAERAARTNVTPAPYAGPLHAVEARTGDRAVSGGAVPYVPAPFRGKPKLSESRDSSPHGVEAQASAPEVDLPWISAFFEEPKAGHVESSADTASQSAGDAVLDAPSSEWPLDETGTELRRIGETFAAPEPRDGHGSTSNIEAGSPSTLSPLEMPMWSGDEWMDIMPVARPESTGRAESTDPSSSEEASAYPAHAAHAARVLEEVAAQVRNGDLRLPGYAASMGDAAAIAATLTAMLGRDR